MSKYVDQLRKEIVLALIANPNVNFNIICDVAEEIYQYVTPEIKAKKFSDSVNIDLVPK